MNSDTEILTASPAGIARAIELLSQEQIVAFPTETVYGLGADATSQKAVDRIFAAKGRPATNPLIVHMSDLAMVERYVILPEKAKALVTAHWPEGLTLIATPLENTGLVESLRAGKPHIAIRVPAATIARALIAAFGRPIAAPSANPSGRISPTTAAHVLAHLSGRIAGVIDGGSCRAGLESTILDFHANPPRILRQGAYIPDTALFVTDTRMGPEGPLAPGQLSSHYAPRARLRMNAAQARPNEYHIGFGAISGDESLSPSGDLQEAAHNLFATLHRADARGVSAIAVAPIPKRGLGYAINDRLERAAQPRESG